MVQPLDLQNVLSKTQASEKIVKLEKSQPNITQQQTAAEFKTKIEHKHKTVQNSNKADEVIIHRDDAKNKNGKNRKNGKKETADDLKLAVEDNYELSEGDSPSQNKHIDFRA
ncbi:MAG: hypothetical protein CO189_09545 [candidate division Zixibacteria bacterium CG_4_9_14_3_um_filter_46_8]|nr:MAG: hypothetical protein CO189_09545 [candidate division Zixibacteria bacterium CG_4_9_14_3_um_filter_46_8]